MKFIGKLILGVFALCIVIFALANRDQVTLSLWPLPLDITVPIYATVLGGVVVFKQHFTGSSTSSAVGAKAAVS